jgi:hypothetical protein
MPPFLSKNFDNTKIRKTNEDNVSDVLQNYY